MKKLLIYLLVIIILCGVIFLIKNITKPNEQDILQEIEEITKKAIETKNVTIKFNDNTIKIKDTYITIENKNALIWQDIKNNEQITISKNAKEASISEKANTIDIKQFTIYKHIKNIKYLKTENYNGNKCYVVENTNNTNIQNKYYINAKTGFLVKQEYGDTEFEVKINSVTNSDVNRPNLNGYEVKNLKK